MSPTNEEELRAAFLTHLNYTDCLANLTDGLTLSLKTMPRKRVPETTALATKLRLAELTHTSLQSENSMVHRDPEYAEACVVWSAAKAYYLTYYLWTTLLHMIDIDNSILVARHTSLLKRVDNEIRSGRLIFNKSYLNEVYTCQEISDYRIPPGVNLANITYDSQTRIKQIRKKLNRYKLDDCKRQKGIKDFRTRAGREVRKEYYSNESLSINQFFYWYRIKANYRDLEFLGGGLNADDFGRYFRSYYRLTDNYFRALADLTNSVTLVRLGKRVFR